jgi:hypothetical protein
MFHWAWSWLSFQRGARLITGDHSALPPVRSVGPDGSAAVHHGASTVALDVAATARSQKRDEHGL